MSAIKKSIQHDFAQTSREGELTHLSNEGDEILSNEDVTSPYVSHEAHLNYEHHNAHPDSVENYEIMQNDDPDSHETLDPSEGVVPKAIYKHKPSGQKYLVKPYHANATKSKIGDGWSEMTTAAMYKAANIPHLIQKTHTTMGEDSVGRRIPVLVVHMDENVVPASKVKNILKDYERQRIYPDKLKIATIDFLTNNIDRHGDNLLFKINKHTGAVEHPIAIDNGAFGYPDEQPNLDMGIQHGAGAFHTTGLKGDMLDYTHVPELVRWWKNNGPMMRLAFEQQLPTITDTSLRDHMAQSFGERYAHMDKKINDFRRSGKWEYK